MKGYPITLNIYAESAEEAERGRRAMISFIDIMRQQGAAVSGNKIVDAVGRLSSSPFVANQIINFLRK